MHDQRSIHQKFPRDPRTTTTRRYLPTGLVNLVNCLDGIQVINPRIDANLVKDGDPSLLGSSVQLGHGRRDIRRRHDVALVFDGRENDADVVRIGNQRNDEIRVGNRSVQVGVVEDIEGERSRRFDARTESRRIFNSSRGCFDAESCPESDLAHGNRKWQ